LARLSCAEGFGACGSGEIAHGSSSRLAGPLRQADSGWTTASNQISHIFIYNRSALYPARAMAGDGGFVLQ